MWSCPRSLSTALLRSFAERKDTVAVDEPFYGAWLLERGRVHPNTEGLVDTLETDRSSIAARLRQHSATPVVYEKQMTQHVSLDFVRREFEGARHAFLIRHPARQLSSLKRVLGSFEFDVTGWEMLANLHDAFGGGAPIVDADDLGRDPARVLRLLCAALGIDFAEEMLTWQKGAHPVYGSWAGDWYAGVHESTGFSTPGALPEVPSSLHAYYDLALPIYQRLYALRLQ